MGVKSAPRWPFNLSANAEISAAAGNAVSDSAAGGSLLAFRFGKPGPRTRTADEDILRRRQPVQLPPKDVVRIAALHRVALGLVRAHGAVLAFDPGHRPD